MIMISVLSGLIGSSTMGVLIAFCSFGIYFYYISRKTNVRLLSIMGINLFFAGFAYLGICVDFISILITGNNINIFLLAFLIWPFVPLVYFFGSYITAELLIPKIKKLYMIIIIALGLIFELSIFLDTLGNIKFIEPIIPGGELIDDSLITGSIAGFIGTIFTFLGLSISGVYMLIKGYRFSGVVRKKYQQVAIGYLILNISALLDFVGITEIVAIIRIASLSAIWFFYLGLREEPEMREKKEKKKELKIEESLFRLTKRPSQITEEEVTYYREQKVCLVCKTNVGGFNNYICTKCDALYCENCARALTDLENACWACNEPIDKTKPTKPFKLSEESEYIEKITEKKGEK